MPCEIIELSDPIVSTNNIVQDGVENTEAASNKNADTSETEAAALTIAAAAESNSGKPKGSSSDYCPFSDSSDDAACDI